MFPADVVDAVAVQAAVGETERSLGPLDIVVPNAGSSAIRRLVVDNGDQSEGSNDARSYGPRRDAEEKFRVDNLHLIYVGNLEHG